MAAANAVLIALDERERIKTVNTCKDDMSTYSKHIHQPTVDDLEMNKVEIIRGLPSSPYINPQD